MVVGVLAFSVSAGRVPYIYEPTEKFGGCMYLVLRANRGWQGNVAGARDVLRKINLQEEIFWVQS